MSTARCPMGDGNAGFYSQYPAITDELQHVGIQVQNPRNLVGAEFVEFVIAQRVSSVENARNPRIPEGCGKHRGVRHILLTNHEIHGLLPKGSVNATLSTSVPSRPIRFRASNYSCASLIEDYTNGPINL